MLEEATEFLRVVMPHPCEREREIEHRRGGSTVGERLVHRRNLIFRLVQSHPYVVSCFSAREQCSSLLLADLSAMTDNVETLLSDRISQ